MSNQEPDIQLDAAKRGVVTRHWSTEWQRWTYEYPGIETGDEPLTADEREALDVMGMFPTSAGFDNPAEWEQETEARLVRAVERIVARREHRARVEALREAAEVGRWRRDEHRHVREWLLDRADRIEGGGA